MSRSIVTIGLIVPTTGGSAYFGEVMERGVRLAISERNEDPAMPVKLSLRTVDDESKPEIAREAVVDFDQTGVLAILGPMDTDTAAVAAEAAAERRIPLISPAATGAYLTDSDNPYFFRAHTSDRERVILLGRWMVGNHYGKSILIVEEAGDDSEPLSFGAAMGVDLRLHFRAQKQAFRELTYPRTANDNDLAEIVAGLTSQPAGVALLGRSSQCIVLGRALRRRFPRVPLYVISPGKGPFAKAFRSDVYAITDTMVETVNYESLTSFRQRYADCFPGSDQHEVIDQYATFCYDAANLLCDAIARLGGPDRKWDDVAAVRADLRQAIESTPTSRRGVITHGGFTEKRELLFVPHRQRLVNHVWTEVATDRSTPKVVIRKKPTLASKLAGTGESIVRHVDSHWLYKGMAIVVAVAGVVAYLVKTFS